MCRPFAYLSVVGLLLAALVATPHAYGGAPTSLLGLYEFDGGGDGMSWEQAVNWEAVLADDGSPLSGDPATPPLPITSADIPTVGVISSAAGNAALDLRIGTAAGDGGLTVTGGDLTVRDAFVGGDGLGALTISSDFVAGDDITIGGTNAGTMSVSSGSVSTGDDLIVRGNGQLNVSGGTIFVGDRLVTEGNAIVENNGGDITADDDFFFFENSQITNNSGSLVVFDKMRLDDAGAKLTINGGVVRSQEFGFEDGSGSGLVFEGVVEINGDGVYQSEQPDSLDDPISQLTLPMARQLIAEGVHLVTSEPGPFKLGAKTVIVPEFDGRTNVPFTQISVVIPEPATALAAMWGGLLLAASRRRRQ